MRIPLALTPSRNPSGRWSSCQETFFHHRYEPSNSVAGKKMTKAEWLSKLADHYGQYAQVRILYSWKATDFKAFI
jgi:hypothetical protein